MYHALNNETSKYMSKTYGPLPPKQTNPNYSHVLCVET